MKVKEVCDLINGRAFKPADWGAEGVPIIRIQNLNDMDAPFNYFSGEYSQTHEINNGELLFSWSGTPGTSFGAFRWNRGKGVLNQHIFRVIPKVAVDKEYLKYALNGNLHSIIEKAHGGVGLQHITKKELDEIEIPIPTITEQKQIVNCLQQTESIIGYRKKQLQSFEIFIKARFVEIFGDYHTNSKGFETHPGIELFKFSSGKFLPEEKRLSDGIPVYGGNGIAWYTDAPLIDYPTIIIGRVGALCGNIHTAHEPVWITDNAIYIKEQKTNKFTLEFLTEMMTIMDFYQYADFSGQPKITQKPLESLHYLTPPIEMQNEFTRFCKQVDKSKVAVKEALDKVQLLFDSLMQKYFG